ncbi:MAG TPA: rod shape-determining protein RodA [Ferruginibacter sp.]|nr:rod shape-determining protein RodA [Ferruginibacter sp.]HRO05476.1 rod shape-determining protein RodA [Ferruginibacter sp.]HRO96192.1 rod shape-determining protein RodA [Ferruginibacter sp.]HRP48953.1 rod shape-determining protein RodA [Ferruginibacter sp.]
MSNQPVIAKGIDWLTVWLYALLVIIGLISIFSAEYKAGDDFFQQLLGFEKNYSKQVMYFAICMVIAVFILLSDSKVFPATANLLYIVGVVLMIATFVIGKEVKGSKSWIPLGFMNLQPVETAKIFTSLALAKYLSLPDLNLKQPRSQAIAAGIAFLPIVFSVLQNETGLALVYFAFVLPMYREGLPSVYLISGASLAALLIVTLLLPTQTLMIVLTVLAALVILFMRRSFKRNSKPLVMIVVFWGVSMLFVGLAVPFMFKSVFQKHQADRIFSLVGKDNPFISADTTILDTKKPVRKKPVENYNVKQSKIAIGSGGLTGKGFLKGTQTQGDFVPEQHTDFIFTAVGENFGFIGSTLVVLLYAALLFRIIFLAERQRSTFSRAYAYCVAGILFFHVLVNIGMTIGLAPVIGITLPLMSYGGSSLLTFTILIFILLKLDSDRQMVIR